MSQALRIGVIGGSGWLGGAIAGGGKLFISVMAGAHLSALAERHKTDRVVRASPNVAAEGLSAAFGKSVSIGESS